MTIKLLISLAALTAAVPAHATQGLLCRTEAGGGPQLSVVIGAGGIAGASLNEGGQWVSTMTPDSGLNLAQAWIDRKQVLIDIVDRAWEPVVQLRVRFEPDPREPNRAYGTLMVRGRVYPVRCEED